MLWLLTLVVFASPALSYRILCVHPVPSQSHNHLGRGIVDALLDAGHEVTYATPFPQKTSKKNLKFIDLSATIELVMDMTEDRNRNAGIKLVKDFSRNISTVALQQPALRQALVNEQFHAVVTEWFFNDVDAGYAAVQQVPWILLSGVTMHPHMEDLVDDVRSIPTHPLMIIDYPVPMNLWQRLVNSFFYVVMSADSWLDFYSNKEFYETSFGPLASARGVLLPPFSSALHNVSILLANQHPSIATPRSVPPNVVDIAGYHIDQNPAPLPKDLQDLMDSSSRGVVYFSMGSVLKSSAMPERTQRELLEMLGEIPYTVLWKFEKELKGVPKNVHIRSWMPQAGILAHPNIRLFITHGGLLSTLEAAHYGVPLLAIPVFGDQPANAGRSVRAGVARTVSFSADMAGQLRVELAEMLNNDRYYKKAKEVSALFRARPVAPSHLIAHYIQLAIESKGAYHLRSPSKLYSWYERWMLDQLGILAVTLYVLYSAAKKAVGLVKNKFSSKKMKKS